MPNTLNSLVIFGGRKVDSGEVETTVGHLNNKGWIDRGESKHIKGRDPLHTERGEFVVTWELQFD